MGRTHYFPMAWATIVVCVALLGVAGVGRAEIDPPGCTQHLLDLCLSREPGTVNNGDTVSYTVTLSNAGFPPACGATDVEVWFCPPGADGRPDLAAAMLLGVRVLDPGDSATYQVPVTLAVDAGVTAATARAWYRGLLQDATPPNLVEEAREVSVCVLPHSCEGVPPGCGGSTLQMHLDRSPALAHNGDSIVYTLTAMNGLFPPACQVTEAEVWFYPPGTDGNPDMGAGILVDSGTTLDPGDTVTYPNIVQTLALNPGVAAATAIACYHGLLQDATPPDVAEGCKEVTVAVFSASIEVTKTATPTTSKTGDTVQYEIHVRNTGTATLSNVTVIDSLLGDLSDSFGDVLLSAECECHTFDYVVQWDDADPLANAVRAEGTDPLGLTVADEDEASVDLVHPDYVLTKTCSPDPMMVGEPMTWVVCVENTGDVSLDIHVVDTSITPGLDETATVAPGGSQCWTRSRAVTADDLPAISNTVAATATLDPGLGLPNVLERTATATCEVCCWPCIEVTKSAAPTSARPGEEVVYTITVCNCGDVGLSNVTVMDSLLGDLSAWFADSLAAGECEAKDFTRTVLVDDVNPLVNVVTASGEFAGIVATDTASAAVEVIPLPPQCCFSYAPALPTTAVVVEFTDCSLAQPPAITVGWQWDFGDGTTSADQNPTHVYLSGGCFETTLTVTDSAGLSATCARCVPVGSEVEVPLCKAGWHIVAQPHEGDHALADIFVRDDSPPLPPDPPLVPFCDVVGSWLQNPLFYYDIEAMAYGLCGCAGANPPTTEHTMRMGHGYWLYAFRDYLTLVFP